MVKAELPDDWRDIVDRLPDGCGVFDIVRALRISNSAYYRLKRRSNDFSDAVSNKTTRTTGVHSMMTPLPEDWRSLVDALPAKAGLKRICDVLGVSETVLDHWRSIDGEIDKVVQSKLCRVVVRKHKKRNPRRILFQSDQCLIERLEIIEQVGNGKRGIITDSVLADVAHDALVQIDSLKDQIRSKDARICDLVRAVNEFRQSNYKPPPPAAHANSGMG